MMTRSVTEAETPPKPTRARISGGKRKLRCWPESSISVVFWMMTETASVAMKPVTCGAPRIGRKTSVSIVMPASAPTARTTRRISGQGVPAAARPSVAKAPIITRSPWAKLISRTMP